MFTYRITPHTTTSHPILPHHTHTTTSHPILPHHTPYYHITPHTTTSHPYYHITPHTTTSHPYYHITPHTTTSHPILPHHTHTTTSHPILPHHTHTTTGTAPAQLLMGRQLRTRLDRLFPDLSQHVQKHQAKQSQHDTAKPLRSFMIDDSVYVNDFSSPTLLSWIPGKVVKVSGPLSYHVELQSGRVVRRHVDAVHQRVASHLPLVTSSPSAIGYGEDLYLPNAPQTHPYSGNSTCSNSTLADSEYPTTA